MYNFLFQLHGLTSGLFTLQPTFCPSSTWSCTTVSAAPSTVRWWGTAPVRPGRTVPHHPDSGPLWVNHPTQNSAVNDETYTTIIDVNQHSPLIANKISRLVFFFFCIYRLVHQELLKSPCKDDFEDAVHLKNKVESLYKNLKVWSSSFLKWLFCVQTVMRPVSFLFFLIWNRLTVQNLTVVQIKCIITYGTSEKALQLFKAIDHLQEEKVVHLKTWEKIRRRKKSRTIPQHWSYFVFFLSLKLKQFILLSFKKQRENCGLVRSKEHRYHMHQVKKQTTAQCSTQKFNTRI